MEINKFVSCDSENLSDHGPCDILVVMYMGRSSPLSVTVFFSFFCSR